MYKELLIILPLLVGSGCGGSPVYLGDADDGATFIARLTDFRGATALPGVLRAIATDRGVRAEGCQLSMRGQVPPGIVASLRAGECFAEIVDESADAPETTEVEREF